MDLSLSARDAAFRDEKLTPELRAVGKLMTSVYADYETTMSWHGALYEKSWVAPAWPVAAKYLNDRAGSIYAGTNEIQRNIMAKAVLGL